MSISGPPTKIRISHDDYHASHVGHTASGDQFFATTPFVPATGGPGREFLAVYLFSSSGDFKEAIIDDLGARAEMKSDEARRLFERRVQDLGPIKYQDIEVAPFKTKRFGVEFGLIPRPPEEDGDDWWVILEPGNYMAFSEPFDGDYDT